MAVNVATLRFGGFMEPLIKFYVLVDQETKVLPECHSFGLKSEAQAFQKLHDGSRLYERRVW